MSVSIELPVVTVFIPTYNRLSLLKRAVTSVLNCGIPVHLHVLDNCSTDGTRSWLDELSLDANLTIEITKHKTNIGSIANFAAGFKSVSTPYFLPLADDDELIPGFLPNALEIAKKNPSLVSVIGSCGYKTNDKWENIHWHKERSTGYLEPQTHIVEFFKFGHYVSWSSCLWKSETIQKEKYFEKAAVFGLPSDVYFQFSVFLRHPVYLIPLPAVTFNYTENQSSSTIGLYSESFKDIGKLLKQINIDLSNTTSGLLKENKKTITLNMVYGFLDFIKHNRNKAFKNNIKMDYAAAWFYYIKYFALDYGFVCFPFENKTFKVKFKRLQKLMNRIKTKISNSSIWPFHY
jgi:glycosyltransferase involved in cell wall biosynthesis